MNIIRVFFPKSGHLFFNFEKGHGDLAASPPPGKYVPVNIGVTNNHKFFCNRDTDISDDLMEKINTKTIPV